MRRYGVTTVSRWLAEELPTGVLSYIEACGTLHELIAIEATSGHLLPRATCARDAGDVTRTSCYTAGYGHTCDSEHRGELSR